MPSVLYMFVSHKERKLCVFVDQTECTQSYFQMSEKSLFEFIPLCFSKVCGRASLNTRIVGGEEASPGGWPWQVFVQTTNAKGENSVCGGSLIHQQWVLTTAHCHSEDK